MMVLNKEFKFKESMHSEILIILLAALSFGYATYIAINYASQPPLDFFSFRQTQTALTAYWFVKDGFSLAYQTPVAGPPWSIPFEFPIYQYIVALLSKLSGFSLNATGRFVSFIFLALCLIPARAITKSLKLSDAVFYIFVALLFSSPLYLYWGRTFMIETTAVFFSVAAIKYFIDIMHFKKSLKHSLLFLIFISLSILQKATTGLPVLALLSLIYIFLNTREDNSFVSFLFSEKALQWIFYFGIPLIIGITWTLYTDHVKSLNGLGLELTSSALSKWNWGSLSQRLSSVFYEDVIWKRIFEKNLSGLLGFAILTVCFLSPNKKSIKLIVIISILMTLIPLFLFTNLHIVHSYYQSGNLIFIIYGLAVSIDSLLQDLYEKIIIVFTLTLIMVTSNYIIFSHDYLETVKAEYNKENSWEYSVSEVLKREIPQDKYFVAFGNLWSSSLPYLSERKSFTVPLLFKQYDAISLNPEHFIKDDSLGGVVLCPTVTFPTINNLSLWASKNRSWKIGEVYGCYIALPEIAQMSKTSKIYDANCKGAIDTVSVDDPGTHNLLSINGWISELRENEITPKHVYVVLKKQNTEPLYFETLQVNRPDVNKYLGRPNNIDNGYSRIINTNSLSGKYEVSIVRLNKGHFEACQFKKEILINGQNNNE